MNTRKIFKVVRSVVRDNTNWLVPVSSAVGIVATGYLVASATVKAQKAIEEIEEINPQTDDSERIKQAVSVSWGYFVPAALTAVVTVGVVSAGSYSMSKRAVTAVSTAAMTEKAFSEYRKSVVREIGEKKEKDISESVVRDQVAKNPPTGSNVLLLGDKTVTCCELYTGRYFKSDMESLKKAVNEINARINNELYVTLDEFYSLLDLPVTTDSSNMGWDSDRLMDLEYSTTLYDDTPCLTFRYNYIKAL